MNQIILNCSLSTIITWEALFIVALVLRLREIPSPELRMPMVIANDVRPPEHISVTSSNSLAEIRARYAELAETEPKRASELMYQEMLALHGK